MKRILQLILLVLAPFLSLAQPANNDCAAATELFISPGADCTTSIDGTVLNATASPGTVSCGGSADDDVWYKFTATDSRVSISISGLTSLTSTLRYEMYEGSCAGTSVFCALSYNNTFTATVTPGTLYYIRLYTNTGPDNPAVDNTFSICLVTPPPAISVSTTQSPLQLVTNIFAAQPGLNISNVTASTGVNVSASEPNGIGSFSQTGDYFPFEDGIILSTGSAKAAEGPNGNIQSAGTIAWGGDSQLSAAIGEAQGSITAKNATMLEFNFVPSASTLSFSFLYASEEYGTFQCDYGDAFAILLTHVQTNTVTNLAVVPGTSTPISSYTVRNGAYNSSCAGSNVSYFGAFYQLGVVDGPINFNGRTTPFFVDHPVTPGANYHIKFVIADRSDQQFDSALFLNGGSFNIGAALPPDDTVTLSPLTAYALCDQDNDGFELFDLEAYIPQVLGAAWPTGNYTVTYFETPEDAENGENAISISGGYTNNLAAAQTLYVRVTLVGNTEVYDTAPLTLMVHPSPIYEDNMPAIATCTGVATDATVNVDGLWQISQYTVTYHTTEADAYNNQAPIAQPEAFIPQGEDYLWVRITDPETGCFEVLLQAVLGWEEFVVVNTDETDATVWFMEEAEAFDFTLALNGEATTQTSFTMDDLNYCSNLLTVTNTTCNTTADFFFDIHPPAPTGQSPQTFTPGQTLADLEVAGTGISWFTAALGGTYLPSDTPLVDGTTYYAAQLIDNCAGLDRLPVTVLLVTGLDDNGMGMLRCYPNPVKDEIRLEHTAILASATLYNTLGQEVLGAAINNTQATLNLSGLAKGVYLMKVVAENGERILKVVKS